MKKGLFYLLSLLFLMSSVYILSAQDKRIYNDGIIDYVPLSASFILSAEDYESTLKEIQYSVDGAEIRVYREPISFTTEGRHIIAYRAIDLTGNISNEKIYSVIVDGTPPEGIATVEGSVYMKNREVYITRESAIILWAEDDLSGVDNIYVRLDDMDFMAYTEPVIITEEGFHTAETYAVDNVGNTTPVFTVHGYVDSTPPSVSIVPAEDFVVVGNENYTNRNNEYTVRAHDASSGVQNILVSFDGSGYVSYTVPFKVQISGFHTVSVKAVDNLGNSSAPTELSFYVDVVPPESKLGTTID